MFVVRSMRRTDADRYKSQFKELLNRAACFPHSGSELRFTGNLDESALEERLYIYYLYEKK